MKRIVELDGIRGIAAPGIVTYHTGLWWHWRHTRFIGSYLLMFVDVFFVLSGYLITSIIVDQSAGTGSLSFLKSFYVRRILRIWPAYYLSLFVLFAWGVPLCGEVFPPSWKAYYLTFTQCIECYRGGPVRREYIPFGQSWSIAVEEQFYLIWPLTVLAFGRRLLWMPIASLIVLAVGMRMSGFDSHILVTRCDALAAAALALLLSSKQSFQSKPARKILWASLLLGASFPVWGRAWCGRSGLFDRTSFPPSRSHQSFFCSAILRSSARSAWLPVMPVLARSPCFGIDGFATWEPSVTASISTTAWSFPPCVIFSAAIGIGDSRSSRMSCPSPSPRLLGMESNSRFFGLRTVSPIARDRARQ